MADFDVGAVLSDMLSAAKAAVDDGWGAIEDHAKARFNDLTNRTAKILAFAATGAIDTEEAEAFLDGIRLNARNAFLAMSQALKNILIKAWNAAMNVLRDAVEKAAGIAIPV